MRGILLWACTAASVWGQTQARRSVDFVRDIHAVLEARCAVCHKGEAAQAGLRVTSRDDLLRGGKSGAAIVPGRGAESLLILKIAGKKGLRMPPSGNPLTEDEIRAFREWIDQGAGWESGGASADRLAPLAPRHPPLPAGAATHPVDRFLPPAATVSDAVFARRAYLDLHGLPPSPEQLQDFVAGSDPRKRTALIDRLLGARQPYAEHWISFWNDLLRNDEGVIYHGERKSITTWLLDALRANMPYDAMVRALLNPAAKGDPEGYLTGVTWRGVVSASQSPPMQAAQNSAQIFLGMNLKCAACHDSFVNRWKLRDTYGLAAMFSPDKLELVRCDVGTGRTAEPGFPIPGIDVAFGASLESRRAAAAQWFTTRGNGRFARTLVNRYWKLLLGRGLIEPVDDMDGEAWNADLLDWLAWDFAENGYDLQHLLRRIMTSNAYQRPAVLETAPEKKYVFRGPLPRRLTAEQFQDALSAVSGDWRVNAPRADTHAAYVREWRLKSDPLSRALGRPIRDQVTTERATQSSTLQALELTNGPLLSERLERAAAALSGQARKPPVNRFDSKLLRSGAAAIDIDISGADELWLVTEDVDSYDPARVAASWTGIELDGPNGTVKLAGVPAPVPSTIRQSLDGGPFTRLRARAVIDEASRKSDISPAVRFFVFTEKPDPERLVRVDGNPPAPAPPPTAGDALVERLFLHLYGRAPVDAERREARTMPLEDLLWAMLMSPEFQYIR